MTRHAHICQKFKHDCCIKLSQKKFVLATFLTQTTFKPKLSAVDYKDSTTNSWLSLHARVTQMQALCPSIAIQQ